jgi:hypothetical protein
VNRQNCSPRMNTDGQAIIAEVRFVNGYWLYQSGISAIWQFGAGSSGSHLCSSVVHSSADSPIHRSPSVVEISIEVSLWM